MASIKIRLEDNEHTFIYRDGEDWNRIHTARETSADELIVNSIAWLNKMRDVIKQLGQ